MSITKSAKKLFEQITSESTRLKEEEERERKAISAHSSEFRKRFYDTQEEIKEKHKAIQKKQCNSRQWDIIAPQFLNRIWSGIYVEKRLLNND